MPYKKITEYIPQREPFVMVDKLLSANAETVESKYTVKDSNPLTNNGEFSEAGLIENIAQTVAAGAGYAQIEEGHEVQNGVIAGIRKLKINFRPITGQTIHTKVSNISSFENARVIFGKVFVGDNLAAECQMNVFIFNTP